MPSILEIETKDITNLSDVQLTSLLKRLLVLEARSGGISAAGVDVALNITVEDGGEDGRINWQEGPDSTEFIPSRFVQYQVKATAMGPAECKRELVDQQGKLKPKIKEALEAGAVYTLFNSKELNHKQKDKRVAAIKEKLKELNEPFANTCQINVLGAGDIQIWVNKYISAIVSVLNDVGRPAVNGIKTFDEWDSQDESLAYVKDKGRGDDADVLVARLLEGKKACRIVGASGLGKTRYALECCRAVEALKHNVIYLDAANGLPNLVGVVIDWKSADLSGVLVIDNCDLDLHKRLRQVTEQHNSNLALLTIHYSTDSDPGTLPVQLGRMDLVLVKAMLESVYAERLGDIDRIAEFAQGFPQMAVLLAEARLDDAPEMGSLTDDDIVRKMLWTGDPPDKENRKMLEAFALFDVVGVKGELEAEAIHIAKEIANVNVDDFFRCIDEFENKGLINSAGRYKQLVPKPLAIRLASDWWKSAQDSKQKQVINSVMPGQLQSSFCNQIEKLDFLPEVKQLTAKLCGLNAPFGQAEVILSEQGSRLFRSLVVVNPEATSSALLRVFESPNVGQFSEIKGDTRQNLVWALERLCFHKEIFSIAIECVRYLAREENESWANNATGLFEQVFNTFLSGTEASPDQRISYIDQLLKGDNSDIQLAVKALSSVINTHGATRTIGAENQGSGAPLQEWRPQIWQNAFDYWAKGIQRLTNLAISENEEAKHTLAKGIRGLMLRSEFIANALDKAIRTIVSAQGPLWVEALDSINDSIQHDSSDMPPAAVALLDGWINLLQPTDIAERLELLVTRANRDHRKDENDEYVDVSAKRAIALAREISNPFQLTETNLISLLEGEQRQSFAFGKELFLHHEDGMSLINQVVSLAEPLETPNLDLLLGMLTSLFETSVNDWDEVIASFSQPPNARHYVRVVSTGRITAAHLETMYDLVSSGELPVIEASLLKYSWKVEHILPSDLCAFALKLSGLSKDSAWVALSIVSMYCFVRDEMWEACRLPLRELSLKLEFREDKHSTQDVYDWKTAVIHVLAHDDPEYSQELSLKILASVVSNYDHGLVHHGIIPILQKIFEMHGESVWPVFSDAIESAKPRGKSCLIQLLNTEGHGRERNASLLSSLSEELIQTWCIEQPDFAPSFVASVYEPFEFQDDRCRLSDRCQFLVDEFGDNKDVLNSLSFNMGMFSQYGSLVPYYERQLAAIQSVEDHPKRTVRVWAVRQIEYLRLQIAREKGIDEEENWGLY